MLGGVLGGEAGVAVACARRQVTKSCLVTVGSEELRETLGEAVSVVVASVSVALFCIGDTATMLRRLEQEAS